MRFGALHLAAQHDALARSQRDIAARAHRFAVAALDAAVDLGLDRVDGLEVVQMGFGVVAQQHPGVEQPGGVDEPLDLAHDLVELVTVLPPHERCHDAPRAVLGLERPALAEHEVDHVVREPLVARKPFGGVEALVEQEVNVAVFRVPEDHRVLVALALEQGDEALARGLQMLDRHRHVFEQRRRARGPTAGDGREEPLAQVPELRAGAGVAAECAGGRVRGGRCWAGRCCADGCCAERPHSFQPSEHRLGRRDARAERVGRLALKLHQQCRVRLDHEGAQVDRCLGVVLRDPQARRVEQLDGREAEGDEGRQRGRRRTEVVEDEKACGHVSADGHRAEGRVGDERQRALAADREAQQKLDGVVVVEERVEAVSHGVLDRVQSRERLDRGGVAAHSVTQSREAGDELGAGIRQPRQRVGSRGVDDGAV